MNKRKLRNQLKLWGLSFSAGCISRTFSYIFVRAFSKAVNADLDRRIGKADL